MVNFESSVYNEDGNGVTGIKVVVKNNVEDIIDTIEVLNATDYQRLNERLTNVDRDHVNITSTELKNKSIEEILTNIGGSVTINATTLDGLDSSDFSRSGHTHSKGDITNLYNTNLEYK